MTVRLATEKDLDVLSTMLADMGQVWSDAAILRAVKDPWITMIHESAKGQRDGFYIAQPLEGKLGSALLGPADGPHDSHEAWLRAICEMGLAIEDEETRRRPKIDPAECWSVTRMWTTVGPLRDTIDSRMAFEMRDGAGKQGFDDVADLKDAKGKVIAAGVRTYWYRRPALVARAKAFLAGLK